MRDRLRFNSAVCLAAWLTAAILPATALAQRCPEGRECTYLPALPPPPPPHVSNPNAYGTVLIFSAPDQAAQMKYTAGDVVMPELGLDATHVAFNPLPRGLAVSPGFGVVSRQRVFVEGSRTYIFVGQLGGADNTYYLSHTRSHTSGIGRRFRLGGFSMNASNGDDMGYDFVGLYAPDGATISLTASPQVYAALQAQNPGAFFWQSGPGAEQTVVLGAGETVVLRTAGAAQVRGAIGAPIDGTEVVASQPISVSVGGRGWLFDTDGTTLLGVDDSLDGIIPIDYLGTQYVLKAYPAPAGQEVRVVADENNTTVRRNGTQVATLAAGETYRFVPPTGTTSLETNHKVAVYQSAGLYNASNDLALVTPVVFADLPNLNVPIDVLTGDIGMLFMVMPTDCLGTVLIDGKDVNTQPFTTVESVHGHPEWTALTYANLIAGGYNITASCDLVVSLVAGNSLYGKGVFTYISRIRRPLCGNGVIDNNEECDDNNIASFDGCSSMCMVEDHWACSGTPSKCVPVKEQETVPNAPAEAGTVDVSDMSAFERCRLLGCAADQWCSNQGCLQRTVDSTPCETAESCLSNTCASDGLCGLPPGSICDDNESCRSNTCADNHCVILTAEGQGNGLMGCALTRASSGPMRGQEMGAVAVVVVSLLAWRKKRRLSRQALRPRGLRAWPILMVGLPLAMSSNAWAQAAPMQGFYLSPFPVPQAGAPFLALDAYAPPPLSTHPKHSLTLRLSGNYNPASFLVRDNISAEVYGAVVARQATAAVTFAYWWRERVRLSATLPVSLYGAGQRVWASPVPYQPPARGPVQGDVSLSAAWAAYELPFWHMGLILGADVSLPSGAASSYVSDGRLNVGASLGVAGVHGPWSYTLAFSRRGHSVRGAYQPGRKPAKWLLAPAIGRYFQDRRWHVGFEMPLSTVVATSLPAYTARTFWAPPLASVRWQPGERWALTLGAGMGVTRAPGEVRWRAQMALDVLPWRSTDALATPAAEHRGDLVLTVRPLAAQAPTVAALPNSAPHGPEATDGATIKPPAETAPGVAPAAAAQPLPYVLHFGLESDALLPADEAALGALLSYLETHPDVQQLAIVGFTDDRGPVAYNLALSKRRANAVRRALIGRGIEPGRLQAEGRGPSEFTSSNATRKGREANRRVALWAQSMSLTRP